MQTQGSQMTELTQFNCTETVFFSFGTQEMLSFSAEFGDEFKQKNVTAPESLCFQITLMQVFVSLSEADPELTQKN